MAVTESTGNRFCDKSGFTLVEMIVVIVIVGILFVLGGKLIVAPVNGYIDLARRTRLVDQAEMALKRMQRDVRQALPNSIRISGNYMELLHTSDGGRYRRYPDPGPGGDDILDFSSSDTGFDVLGDLRAIPDSGDSLVVYNYAASGSAGNAYDPLSQNRVAINDVASAINSISILPPGYQFANASPFQRFFITDEPVTYACESGSLNRYSGYGVTPVQATPPAATPDLVTRGNVRCNFSYDPGASQRAGLVTLRLELTEAGETITLLHQIHVVNAP